MAKSAGDYAAQPVRTIGPYERRTATFRCVLGATGAVGQSYVDGLAGVSSGVAGGFTLTRTGTGLYTLVGPPCLDMDVFPSLRLVAAYADAAIHVLTVTASTGTVTLETSVAGSAADLASTNQLVIHVEMRATGGA